MAFQFFLFNLSEAIGGVVLACYALLALAGIREYMARRREGERADLFKAPGVFLALWFAGPVLLTFALSLVMQPMFVYRYFAIATMPAYVLLARALFRAPVAQKWQGWMAGAVTALLLIHLLVGLKYLVRPWHAQYREAAEYVAQHEPARDGVVLGYVWGADGRYYDYYFERAGSPLRVRFANGEKDIPELAAYLEKTPPQRLWFIITNHAPEPEMIDCLKAHMVIKERIRFYEAEIWLYVPRTPG
ncbi:MAG: hypothetical protein HY291_15250 [Planctomycetes bacterium]|nr:hypothetical protein [Planctomycetota bacterium]